MNLTIQERIRCIEGQIHEAITLFDSAEFEPFGKWYEVCHVPSILRDGLVHLEMLKEQVKRAL